MLYNWCTGIYKFGNNTYPRRIRRGSNLGHIFQGKKCVLRAGKYGIYNYIPETNHVSRVYSVAAVLYLQFVLHVMLFHPWNMLCTFTLALSVVCVQSPILLMTRSTNLMQQLWFIIINISTCFGHVYAHLQEYRLYVLHMVFSTVKDN